MKKIQLLAFSVLTAMAANAQIVINEYCANSTSFLDEYGDSNDWIELLNTSSADVNLEGWHLSDKADNLAKWTFPAVTIKAGGYLKVFASSKDLKEVANGKFLHTNFNISSEGEAFYLSDASGKIVHQTDTLVVPNDVSRGLSPDGNGKWVFFAEPTPGAANTTKAFESAETPQVTISPEGGVKTSKVTITLSTSGNSPIYYTLDCTVPTAKSKKYTGPITVDTTTVIRAITFNDDMLPAQPATQSYIFGKRLRWVNRDKQGKPITTEQSWGGWGGWGGGQQTTKVDPNKTLSHSSTFDLPVVSLTTAPDNLWDYNTGLIVEGPNADLDATPRRANYYNDWEKPIHVEIYKDGEKIVDQDAGVQVAGAYSRMNDQKSLSIHARSSYGKKYFDAKIFDELDLTRFKAFTLRNSGNDFGGTHFRDAMITHLVAGTNIDIQAYQPAVVFLNGEYYGILNIREKINEHYIEEHYPHVDHDKVDLIVASDVTKDMSAKEGDMKAYDALISYVESNDMSTDACYLYIKSVMDMDEYMEYIVSEIFGSNNDWPHNNVKMWKSKKAGGRWRWFLFDTDQCYSIWSDQSGDDKLATCLSEKDQHGNTWANKLFRNLAKNKQFKNELANRFADRMNNEFLQKNINHLIDSLFDNISTEIGSHNQRWGKGTNDGNGMKEFAKKRPQNVRDHLRKHFNVGADVKVTISTSDAKAGYVQLNSLTLKKFPWSGTYFKNVPISIRAVARPGYKFSHWEDADGNNAGECEGISVTLATTSKYTAIFEADDSDFNNVVINEINYKSADDFDTKDWIELYNTTSAGINLAGWKISAGSLDEAFTIPMGTIIPPYGYLVVSSNQNKLIKLNPNLTGVSVVGDFEFGLGKTDKVQLLDSEGNLVDEIEYAKSWGDADGTGRTLALTDPFADNANYKLWSDNDLHGTPGSANGTFNPSHSDFTIADLSFTVDIDELDVPEMFAMCYPNPVGGRASLLWQQTTDANVRIELFNSFGYRLALIDDVWYSQGRNSFDISYIIGGSASGLYVAKICVDGQNPVIVRIIKR
ncbi:MAG: CotH kinase family protein [Salinivirgaceae bacterium]|nr:CotH kinase family protein [Salinivirgaceae bacterium]